VPEDFGPDGGRSVVGRDWFRSDLDCEQPAFEENGLPALVDAAGAQVLRFDLAPEELVQRQVAGVLLLDGKEVIVRRNADGTTTPYYRDRPDCTPLDNLLALPQYTPPYQPPGHRS
jgi:hypothetical protein